MVNIIKEELPIEELDLSKEKDDFERKQIKTIQIGKKYVIIIN